jgi:hypothetical protein
LFGFHENSKCEHIMSPSYITLKKDDFVRSRWEDMIASCPDKECQRYSAIFRAKEAEASGDAQARAVFALLGAVASFNLNGDSVDEPFTPALVFQNSRSASPDDITDAQLEVLREVVAEARDPEMRARIADLLWVRKRDFRMAELAIESYLDSADVLKSSKSWLARAEKLERAVNLAASLGRNTPRFDRVISHIETALNETGDHDARLLSLRLMSLLQKYRKGDPSRYASMAETAALLAEADHDWGQARAYWEAKAAWHAAAGDPEKERDTLVSAAETYAKDAEDFISQNPPSYISACAQIQRAIVALRKVEGTKGRVDILHKLLLEYEEKANAEMRSSPQRVDFSKYVEDAREQVRGKSFNEALFSLALMFPHPSVAELRKQILEHVDDYYSFRDTFCAVEVVNERGKVIGRKPSFVSSDPKEVERAIEAEMLDLATRFRWMYAYAYIEPARLQINLEHKGLRARDLLSVVTHNPFVPPGREDLYALGLYAGLKGDFVTSAHVLIPQLENSIRHVLEQYGWVVSGLDQSGIQKEYDLNKAVETFLPQLQSIFGEDLVFDFRGLLIERFGSNLRNRLAHGLISSQQFLSPAVAYLWWLALRLCLLPVTGYEGVNDEEGFS